MDNFRLMWFENSVKYLKPFSPQPTQFPENPAGGGGKREAIDGVCREAYLQAPPTNGPAARVAHTGTLKKQFSLIWDDENTHLKVHFSHSRQARSGGPRRTPGCSRGRWGTLRRPARSLLGLRWALLPWRPDGDLCQPDRNLRRRTARH